MSIKRFLVFILFLILTCTAFAQENEHLPEIAASDIPGGVIIKKNYYDKNTLWGYINGGADIYLEYGLDKVVVQELKWQEELFKVEIYKMLNPLSAFGIYSVSKGKCNPEDSLSQYSCVTAYQTVIFKNNFYISVINETGTDEAKRLSRKISEILIGNFKQEEFRLPGLFELPEFNAFKKDVKYFNGILGLQNSLPEMAGQFENLKDYNIFYLPAELKNGFMNLFIISFSSEKDVSDFTARNSEMPDGISDPGTSVQNKLNKKVFKLSGNKIIYLESDLSSGIINTYTDAINDYIRQHQ